MALPRKRMALSFRKSIQRYVYQALIYLLDMWRPVSCSAEVTREELQEAEMRSDQVVRSMLSLYY